MGESQDENQNKGHYLICPDFGSDRSKLSNDTQVRCLCYILERIHDIATVPTGIQIEIIPLRWHHSGAAYPSLGIPADEMTGANQDITRLSFVVGDQITEFINRVGLDNLIKLSEPETMVWADVLKPDKV